MSQIEQRFRDYIHRKPEIEKCYALGVINRRSLARFLIRSGVASQNQFDALIAMIRRFEFKKPAKKTLDLFKNIRTSIRDGIIILDFEKNMQLVEKIQKNVMAADTDKGESLKLVVGTSSVKLFIEEKNQAKYRKSLMEYGLRSATPVSELSIQFPTGCIESMGIIAILANEFFLNDINITEMLTASPELLIYLKEENVLKAYGIIQRMKKSAY